jgi:hypothetical protein
MSIAYCLVLMLAQAQSDIWGGVFAIILVAIMVGAIFWAVRGERSRREALFQQERERDIQHRRKVEELLERIAKALENHKV